MNQQRLKKYFSMLLGIMMCILVLPTYGKEIKKLFPAMERTSQGNAYGYINERGKWVVKPGYDYTYPFSDGLGVIIKDNRYGVINAEGNKIVKPIYESITPFQEERAIFVNKKGMGVLDSKGNVITKKTYSYVSEYEEGMAVIEGIGKDGKALYGYIDREGKEIIPAIYQQAARFNQGKALVQLTEGEYAIIDAKGQILTNIQVPVAYGYSEQKLIYGEQLGGPVGYRDETGQVIIKPIYQSAEPFKEGVAIVSTSPSYRGEQGLINEKGDFIYPNIYNEILYLGEGHVALGKAIDVNHPINGSVYAIADTKGNILTNFIYYGVAPYEEGIGSAYDETTTYFINLEGEIITSLPQVIGAGSLEKQGEVIVADIDYQTSYLTPEGEVIYTPNTVIELGKGYQIKVDKYKPDLNTLIYRPQVEGMKDLAVQKQVNEKLKTLSQDSQGIKEDDKTYYSQFENLFYSKDLWIPQITNSTYYFGAAHPFSERATPAIDLVKGTFYKLKDLFDEGKDWEKEINTILEDMAKKKEKKNELFEDAEVKIQDNQPFYVDSDALYIYYPPYEIGPYSSGFITFRIPYTEITHLLNKKGDFWMAYH